MLEAAVEVLAGVVGFETVVAKPNVKPTAFGLLGWDADVPAL